MQDLKWKTDWRVKLVTSVMNFSIISDCFIGTYISGGDCYQRILSRGFHYGEESS